MTWIPQSCRCHRAHNHAWWRHQMETFSALLAICAGNSPVPGEFLAQRPVTRSFDVFFDLRVINGWVNNGEAGDLRRYRAHYDVTVMFVAKSWSMTSTNLPTLDKMNANFADDIFRGIFMNWIKSLVLWFEFHWSLFVRVQFTIILVWVIAWSRTGDKPFQH